jgi:hypothetical protein
MMSRRWGDEQGRFELAEQLRHEHGLRGFVPSPAVRPTRAPTPPRRIACSSRPSRPPHDAGEPTTLTLRPPDDHVHVRRRAASRLVALAPSSTR